MIAPDSRDQPARLSPDEVQRKIRRISGNERRSRLAPEKADNATGGVSKIVATTGSLDGEREAIPAKANANLIPDVELLLISTRLTDIAKGLRLSPGSKKCAEFLTRAISGEIDFTDEKYLTAIASGYVVNQDGLVRQWLNDLKPELIDRLPKKLQLHLTAYFKAPNTIVASSLYRLIRLAAPVELTDLQSMPSTDGFDERTKAQAIALNEEIARVFRQNASQS